MGVELEIINRASLGQWTIGSNFDVTIEIRNLGPSDLSSDVLFLEANSYNRRSAVEVPQVPRLKDFTVTMRVHVKAGVTASDLPKIYTYEYKGKKQSFGPFPMSSFCNSITSRRPQHIERFNIVVYGVGGAGNIMCGEAGLILYIRAIIQVAQIFPSFCTVVG
jgi:hypothetical protein